MSIPLVSVIIPTAGRPSLLPKAVESALIGMQPRDVEVIVVPNGPDTSWQRSLAVYRTNSSVRLLPIDVAHANQARTHGMRNAQGKYIRFLDDDDFLLPEAACRQYEQMEMGHAEVSSGYASIVGDKGQLLSTLRLPDTEDFVEGCLAPDRLPLPSVHLFSRIALQETEWDSQVPRAQDILWLHSLCRAREFLWIKSTEPVSTWYQHRGIRTSLAQPCSHTHELIAESTISTVQELQRQSRLSTKRLDAAANALWASVHTAFYLRPIYWHRISSIARSWNATSRPAVPLFNMNGIRMIDPALLEWIILPKRKINYWIRSLRARVYGWPYERTL